MTKGRDFLLTNESKTILDYLISAFPNYESSMMNFIVISENTGLSLSAVDSALQYLESLGYVRIKRYKGGGFVQDVTHQGMHYKELESVTAPTAQTNIFNAPVTGSAIGNFGAVTINNEISVNEALSFIRSQDISAEDKAEAEKMVTYIEALIENEAPLKKGFLSKFSDILAKHHWLPELAMKLLFQYLTGQ